MEKWGQRIVSMWLCGMSVVWYFEKPCQKKPSNMNANSINNCYRRNRIEQQIKMDQKIEGKRPVAPDSSMAAIPQPYWPRDL